MTLWFVFALMTAAAIFAVLLPLGLRGSKPSQGEETTVYKDQLAEIDRDLAAGLIVASEAEAARTEIGRRLLAAADPAASAPLQSNQTLRRVAAVVGLIGLPAVALLVYLPLGSPRMPDFPLAARRTPSRSTAWSRRSSSIWRRIRLTVAAGACWPRSCCEPASMTTRCAPS